MSAIFVLGELGECFSQQSLIPFTKLIERYFPDNYQSFSDIFVILDSNGSIIEQLPQNVLIMGDTSTKYYLYSKTFNSEIYANIFEECINKVTSSSSFANPINISNFGEIYQFIDEKRSYLKFLTAEDTKYVYDKMQEFYKNFHVIYNTMKINSKICEKIKECYSYQYCGIKCMTKYINDIQNQCEKSKEDAKNEFNRLIEIKEESIESMEKSLNILKSLELHPKMQVADKKKYLIDIYYPEDKMKIWKDNCIEKTTFFKNYFNEKSRLFVNENNKIVKEKSTIITDLKNEWNLLGGEYDNLIATIETKINIVHSDLSNEFIQFKDALTKVVELIKTNPLINTSQLEEYCKLILALKNKYSSFDALDKLSDSLEPLNDLCSKMRKSMERIPQKINNLILTFESMGNTISELTDKFISLSSNRLLELESSFETFFYPSYFPEAYEASINEIKRRVKVNAILNKLLDMSNQIKKTENEHRKEFLSKYGKFLPSEFYPNLKSYIKYQQEEIIDDDTEAFPNLFAEDELQMFLEQLNIPDPFNGSNSNYSNSTSSLFPKTQYWSSNKDSEYFIESLKKEKDSLYDTIQKINDDFMLLSSMKEKQLNEKKNECDNLLKKLLSKVNVKYDNCPMCLERSISNGDYQSWSSFTKELQRKINDRDKAISMLEKKIESIIMQTTRIKKSFFDHMNYVIVKKNNDINELKGKLDLLTSNASNCSINTNTNGNNPSSNAGNKKLESELIEMKDLLDKEKLRAQMCETELMLLQQKHDKQLTDSKKTEMKLNDIELQLNKKTEQVIKLLQEQQAVKKENEKLVTKCKNDNYKTEQIQSMLTNVQNELKVLKQKNEHLLEHDGVVNIKVVQKGIRCIFVPYSEGAYACIHFGKGEENNHVFILNMEVFDEELKDIVLDNSLIVIGFN